MEKYLPCNKLTNHHTGKEYMSKNGGKFKVLGVYNRKKTKTGKGVSRYVVEFLKTGYTTSCWYGSFKTVRDKTMEIKHCSFCGISSNDSIINFNTKYNGYLCRKHYSQYYKDGKLMKRTIRDPNEIITSKKEKYATVFLYNKNCDVVGKGIIDIEDVVKVKKIKWGMRSDGYISNNYKNKKTILLHRFIMNYEGDLLIDHINGDKLDNRKSNLRIVRYSQNGMNKKIQKNNTSGVVGVRWSKKNKVWLAQIKKNKIVTSLGCFKCKSEAEKARKDAEIEYFGEYRYDYDR